MNAKLNATIVISGALLLGGTLLSAHAQEVKRPPVSVPETADSALQLVPAGWRGEKEMLIEADLNGDGRADAVLIISHGGFVENGPLEFPPVKHVLVLALRGADGKLHRSIVSDSAILDGDEGGAFGDPFEGISVDKGSVVISHYGGSRERWGYGHTYRYQNGQWMLTHLAFGNTDTLDLEHYDNHEIDLTTGLVGVSEKGSYEGEPKKPETGGEYYELQVPPADRAPAIDGRLATDEWPGYAVQLNQRREVYRQRKLWHGPNDLSAKLHAVWYGANLFICAEVTDNEVTAGDTLRLVTRKGIVIRSSQSKIVKTGKGYIYEASYSLKLIGAALKHDHQFVVDEGVAENIFTSLDDADAQDFSGLELPVSVEVIDVDRSTPKLRSVLSTRLLGSPYSGAIRFYRKGTMVLRSDSDKEQ